MGARRWPARLAAVVLAALAAGCELHAAVDVELEVDGGGQMAVTLEADEELAARAAEQPIDPLDELADVGRTLAPGWETDAHPTEGGGRAITLVSRFDDPDELERLSAAFSDALEAPELDPLDRFTVTFDHDQLRIAGRAGLEPTGEVADFGLDPPAAVALLSDTVDYRVRVRVAGEVLETTADGHEDGTLTWRVPAGSSVEILAVADRPRGPRAWPVAGVAAVVLVGGAAAGWWARRRSRATGIRTPAGSADPPGAARPRRG